MKLNKPALKDALLTALYIILVASFMFYGGEAKIGRSHSFLVPITILMLFVTSAAITGYLIFGKPLQMYLDGKKREAINLLTHTLIYFAAITFLAIILLITFTR